ncbi:retroviral-like aspartic protease family protein [Candidatus Woesearchaeota archaeon]|nr:retroviral-like aspartic protease family protein [Candidatus Woesearchaeota archaeon]
MADRIPLQVVEGRITLKAVIENPKLRISHHIVDFVIDTGSQDSFLSQKDVIKLQIPVSGKPTKGEVDFGGSRFKQVELPPFNVHLLNENQKAIMLKFSLTALKTTKSSEKKIQIAETLPSILGTDFLKCTAHELMS